jgi:hypothetical protein
MAGAVITTVGISSASKPLVRIATHVIKCDPGGPQLDILDGGRATGTLDPGPDTWVVVAAAPLRQGLMPSICLDRRKPTTGIYRCKFGQFADW